ncbi:MAG: DUF4406 domain-containing protein [Nitrososphaera sp.]
MKKVYYAHPISMYGTQEETKEVSLIKEKFRDVVIVNPAVFEQVPKGNDIMEFYFKIVRDCDMVVFRRLLGKVSAGVGKEVNFALQAGKAVYELDGGQFAQVTQAVEPISVEETRRLLALSLKARSQEA